MTHRVSFGTNEQRRDQRRPVSVEGRIDGGRVDLIDLSITGVGGGTIALGDAASLDIREGQNSILELTGANGQPVSLPVEIQRIDGEAGGFGAKFSELSDDDFDAIEKLMFPRRARSAAKA